MASVVEKLSNLIEIRGLHFLREDRCIFNNVDLDIPQGKVTAIMGPSGTGKTTLLRLIGAQLTPDAGVIKMDSANIHQLSRRGLYELRSQMGMLFQSAALFTDISVFENVAFPLREHTNFPEEMIHDIVLMKLQAVGLRGAAALMPHTLSGGMARRVALARAIALDPRLVLYDEPFTGQDPISMGVLLKLVRMLNDALGLTSIIVSHDVDETLSIADYAYIIADGKVVGHGTPADLAVHPSPWIQQFIHGWPDGPVPFHYPAPDYVHELLEDREA